MRAAAAARVFPAYLRRSACLLFLFISVRLRRASVPLITCISRSRIQRSTCFTQRCPQGRCSPRAVRALARPLVHSTQLCDMNFLAHHCVIHFWPIFMTSVGSQCSPDALHGSANKGVRRGGEGGVVMEVHQLCGLTGPPAFGQACLLLKYMVHCKVSRHGHDFLQRLDLSLQDLFWQIKTRHCTHVVERVMS